MFKFQLLSYVIHYFNAIIWIYAYSVDGFVFLFCFICVLLGVPCFWAGKNFIINEMEYFEPNLHVLLALSFFKHGFHIEPKILDRMHECLMARTCELHYKFYLATNCIRKRDTNSKAKQVCIRALGLIGRVSWWKV